jgi:hypothetical protein
MTAVLMKDIDTSVDADARDAFNALVRNVREATDREPALYHAGDELILLAADAFAAREDQSLRERRWKRLVRALAPIATKTGSQPLLDVVRENRDLLVC